jgi:serine/threonine-protein kinase RsbW
MECAKEVSIEKIEFPSGPGSIYGVEELLTQVKSAYEIEDNIYQNMVICLTEAVNNAIFHGNKSDPGKKVRISSVYNDHSLSFVVSDEGEGFDYSAIPDPTMTLHLKKEHGRGLFLIKELSDGIIFAGKGNVVFIYFLLNKQVSMAS